MANPASQPSISKSANLLSLPAELRNLIYGYCIESEPEFSFLPGQSLFSRPKIIQHFEYLSLAHVCTLLRAEFRPLYMKDTKIVVLICEVSTFLDVFFLPSTSDQLHRACGNITVHLARDEVYATDVTRLLEVRACAPRVQIKFQMQDHYLQDEARRRLHVLNQVLFPPVNSQYFQSGGLVALAPLLSRVEVKYGGLIGSGIRRSPFVNLPSVKLCFKKAAARGWMDGKARVVGSMIPKLTGVVGFKELKLFVKNLNDVAGQSDWYITSLVDE
ncbi:hypothetical protein CC86DRAFT_462927 [Ophiobolus disseminans]|uniref:F-box domain-containing protein n=1 Tax=Ophiobolus disseminans TaxID=1469910 RepID=A0A6A7AHY1_9PLEO|nr:hypothetical protein CC86DRAFT_462927 [Ophiobolus disseminans]